MTGSRRASPIIRLLACACALGLLGPLVGCGRYGPPKRKPPTASDELRDHRAAIANVERADKQRRIAAKPAPKRNAAQLRRTGN